MSEELTIQPYSDKSVLVQGDYDKYARQMKKFQARWNPRLKAGPGWLVPIDFESAVRSYFQLEDPVEDIRASQRFRPAPASKSLRKPVVAESDEESDEEDVHHTLSRAIPTVREPREMRDREASIAPTSRVVSKAVSKSVSKAMPVARSLVARSPVARSPVARSRIQRELNSPEPVTSSRVASKVVSKPVPLVRETPRETPRETVSAKNKQELNDTDNEDIVSLARKMKDMMIRLERLEYR